jgi:PAS domain S-box-containing protein
MGKRIRGGYQFGEDQFRALMEQSADAIQLVTPAGEVLYSSDVVKNIMGYSPKEIQGANITSYLHPDDTPAFMKRRTKLLQKPGSHITLEYRIRHKDGSWVWVETTLTNHLSTPGIEAVVGNFRNITERKRTESKLRESEAQYRLLSDHSPEAIVVHAEGRIMYANRAAASMIGARNAAALLDKPIAQFVHPDYLPMVADRVKQILTGGKPTPLMQEKFVRLDGGIIDVEVISLPINYKDKRAVQVVIRDVTERLQAVEALRESEARLRFMAESLPQKIFTATAEGNVDYFNRQWAEYTGISMEALLRDGVRHRIHPDDLPGSMREWRWALKTGQPMQNEQRLLRADGQYRRHISYVRAMHDEAGNVLRWFGSMTDIEDIERTTEERDKLEQVNARLEEQRLMLININRTKDEFISLASHQLRTPATGVKQFLGMVLDGFAGDVIPEQHRMLERAYESNERQIAIINDLLKVAQADAGKIKLKKKNIDLVQLVQDVLDEQASKFAGRRQKVDFTYRTSPVLVSADASRLRMVLDNLIDNASKYTFEGKSISVKIIPKGGNALIAIRDKGVGISAHDIDKLFHKFMRLDNPLSASVGGSGLGLYWAKKVIDLHGGSIAVTSNTGEGSTFTVCLPVK